MPGRCPGRGTGGIVAVPTTEITAMPDAAKTSFDDAKARLIGSLPDSLPSGPAGHGQEAEAEAARGLVSSPF